MLGILLAGWISLAVCLFFIACLAVAARLAERSAIDKRRLAAQLHTTASAREARARSLEAEAEAKAAQTQAEADRIIACADALWRRTVEFAAKQGVAA